MCAVAAGHDVSYTADAITITMYESQRRDYGCHFGGVGSATESVELNQAIAGRRIIDGACAAGQPSSTTTICEPITSD